MSKLEESLLQVDETIELQAKDIILPPFMGTTEELDEHTLHYSSMDLSESQRFKIQSFLSTPIFFKCLTDVSLKLSHLKASKEDKLDILKEDLK